MTTDYLADAAAAAAPAAAPVDDLVKIWMVASFSSFFPFQKEILVIVIVEPFNSTI